MYFSPQSIPRTKEVDTTVHMENKKSKEMKENTKKSTAVKVKED